MFRNGSNGNGSLGADGHTVPGPTPSRHVCVCVYVCVRVFAERTVGVNLQIDASSFDLLLDALLFLCASVQRSGFTELVDAFWGRDRSLRS